MKKKRINYVLTTLVLSATLIFVGCGKEKVEEGTKAVSVETDTDKIHDVTKDVTDEIQPVKEKVYTVTFMGEDGKTELSKVEVKEAGLVSNYVPDTNGAIFRGWYGTPSLSHEFDFTKPITEDTIVFGGFLEHKDDTRAFAIVGSGTSPILLSSQWGKVLDKEHYLTKKDRENVYEMTLDLFEGDEFQLAINDSWHNQRGAGYMTVTNIDGVDYFANSGGVYSNDTKRSNIKVSKTGSYTITLTTYPGADFYKVDDAYYTEEKKEGFNLNPYDTITWTYNGDATSITSGEAEAELKVTYFIKGAKITNWEDRYDKQYMFIQEGELNTLTLALEEGDEFLFTTLVGEDLASASVGTEYVRYSNIKDATSLTLLDGSASYNMISKSAATYTFTYNSNSQELTVSTAK